MVLINMKMPRCCGECKMFIRAPICCCLTDEKIGRKEYNSKRLDDCPLADMDKVVKEIYYGNQD